MNEHVAAVGMGETGFADRIKRNVGILVAQFRVCLPLICFHDTFFFLDEGPDFVTFYGVKAQSTHGFIHHPLTTRSDLD